MIDRAMRSLFVVTALVGMPRTDGLAAEPLPPHAVARIGDHRFYHGPDVRCAALSPDGRHIASAAYYEFDTHVVNAAGTFQYTRGISDKERDTYDPIVVLWDAATGERVRELRVPHSPVQTLVFSPDGKRLAVATGTVFDRDYRLFVFALESGKLLWQQRPFEHWLDNLRFSAEGQLLSAGEWHGPVRVWDAATGKQLRLWKPPADEGDYGVESGVLSPDGKVIAWEINRINERKSVAKSVGLQLHDADTDKRLYQIKLTPPDSLESFTFSADGKRLAAAHNDKFTVWETATGKKVIDHDVPAITRFTLSPNGRHAAIYEFEESRLRIGELQTGKWWSCHHFGLLKVGRCQFSFDGRVLLLNTNSALRLFDPIAGKERSVPGHRAPVQCRYSKDGKTLFTSCDEKRCSWNVAREKEPMLLASELRKPWEFMPLAHSSDDRLLLNKSDGSILVRETAKGRIVRKLEKSKDKGSVGRQCFEYLAAGLFSPDATQVVLRYRGGFGSERFHLSDVKTGKSSGEIKIKQKGDAVYSPNGRILACADGDEVCLYDTATCELVRTLHSSRFLSQGRPDGSRLLFSPDGEQLIVATFHYDNSKPVREECTTLPTRIFQISSGQEILRFYADPEKKDKAGRLSCMLGSPDGRVLAIAADHSGMVRLLEIASGKVRAEFIGHRHGVRDLAFAPDGKTLASGGEDNVVFLWDVTGAKTLPEPKTDLAAWWKALASDDGKCAGRAIASMIRKPEASGTFLQEKLRPDEPLDRKRLAQLIRDLDADAFETRETANRELLRLGERAEAALRRELANRPPLEVRRRIDNILSKLEPAPLSPETLRTLRAIEVLEHIATPAARRCLEALAEGAAEARQTYDAKAALRRLAKKRT